MPILDYIKKTLKSLGFSWFSTGDSKMQQLEKMQDFYSKMGKRTKKIQIENLKKQ